MSAFDHILDRVTDLAPGQRLPVDDFILNQGWGGMEADYFSSISGFTPADRVLENVIGSSMTHGYKRNLRGQIEFFRLYTQLPEGIRSYVSPDRVHYFRKRDDDLWQHREAQASERDELLILCALHGHRWGNVKFPKRIEAEEMIDAAEMAASQTIELVDVRVCWRCRTFDER